MPVIIDLKNADAWLNGRAEHRKSLCLPVPSEKQHRYKLRKKWTSVKVDRNPDWAIEPAQHKHNDLVLSLQLK